MEYLNIAMKLLESFSPNNPHSSAIAKKFCLISKTELLFSTMQAARETGALKEAKDKLEKRVEELTWRLDFEKHMRVHPLHPVY